MKQRCSSSLGSPHSLHSVCHGVFSRMTSHLGPAPCTTPPRLTLPWVPGHFVPEDAQVCSLGGALFSSSPFSCCDTIMGTVGLQKPTHRLNLAPHPCQETPNPFWKSVIFFGSFPFLLSFSYFFHTSLPPSSLSSHPRRWQLCFEKWALVSGDRCKDLVFSFFFVLTPVVFWSNLSPTHFPSPLSRRTSDHVFCPFFLPPFFFYVTPPGLPLYPIPIHFSPRLALPFQKGLHSPHLPWLCQNCCRAWAPPPLKTITLAPPSRLVLFRPHVCILLFIGCKVISRQTLGFCFRTQETQVLFLFPTSPKTSSPPSNPHSLFQMFHTP